MQKKKIWIIASIVGVFLITLGISFALWYQTLEQTDHNILQTACFEIEFLDGDAISLSKAFPMIDEDGLKNTPYTFTIKNICNDSAKYQINLETLNPSGVKLPDKYLKANLQEDGSSKVTTKLDKELNTSLETSTTIEGAMDAYKLFTGILEPNETKEFHLRLWMHSDVTQNDEDSMNANFAGKVSIIASYYQDNRGTMMAVNASTASAFYPYKSSITKIVMEDEMNPKETELVWDVSSEKNGSVMSYLVPNEDDTTYTLYLQSDGGIKANSNSSYLFFGFSNLESIEGLEYLDTSKVTSMSFMFNDCRNLTSLDVSQFDTSKVTNMSSMFMSCGRLTNLDVSSFDTSNVTNMGFMFNGCGLTSLDVSSFNTSKVTNMSSMFNNCVWLTSLDVSSFDTSNVTSMSAMFQSCRRLTNLDVSHFDTSKVTDMHSMFSDCRGLTNLDVSHFDTSKVTNMSSMFASCTKLINLNVSHFDTSNVTDMRSMFMSCGRLTNLDVSSFDTSKVTNMSSMFENMSTLVILRIKDGAMKDWIMSTGSVPAWTDANFEIVS